MSSSPRNYAFFMLLAITIAGGAVLTFSSGVARADTELITNGSFASGSTGWVLSGNFFADSRFSVCHSCPGYAYLSNADGSAGNNLVGTIYQTVTIPSTATSATLSFWYNITSQATTSVAFDVLNVTIQNSGGGFLATVAVLSNVNQGTLGAYVQISFNMTPYIGQTVRVNFLGTTDGSLPTTFRIDDVSLLSTVPATSQITVGPSSLNFGEVAVNSCGTASFVIQHIPGTGPASGTVSSPSPPFSIFSGNSFSVSNGSVVTVTVQFCPTSAGSFSSSATVSSSATFTGTNTVTFFGTGVQNPILNINTHTVGFGTVNVGSSADQTFTIDNRGGSTLTGSVVNVGPNPPFSLVAEGSFSLGAGQSQQVTIRFTPQSGGSFTGNASVSSNVGSDTVSLIGTGQTIGPPDSITVTAGPTATPNPVASGGQVQVSVSASDTLGHSLGYIWTGSGGSFANTSSATTTWTAPPNLTGTTQNYTLSVTVNDLGGSAASQTRSLTVQVQPAIDTVTITSGPSGTPNPVASGGAVSLSVTAADTLGHTLSYNWLGVCSGLPSNGSFSNLNAQNPIWTAPTNTTGTAKSCTFTVTASDGGFGHSDTKSFTETVNAATTDTVTIMSGPSGTPNPVASGGAVSLSVSATDSLNHTLSYTWSALCSGLASNGSFNNASIQNPTWTAPTNTTGSAKTCTLTVTASDGLGHTDTKNFTETVNSENQQTGTLTVTVRRSDTSAALQRATVSLSGPSSPPSQTTSSDGTAIFTNLVVGSYTVMASLAGFQPNSASATVVTNTTTPVTVLLTPTQTTGTIEVKATFNAKPWSGAVVFRLDGPGGLTGVSVPFSSSNSPVGNYTLSYSSGGPPEAIFTGIAPAVSQQLENGAVVTFTLHFQSHPILLVHGWNGCASDKTWGDMKNLLSDQFSIVDYFDNAPDGSSSGDNCVSNTDIPIETLAISLTDKVNQIRNRFPRPEAVTVDVVAHSMGGLVARTWIAQKKGPETPLLPPYNGEIRRLITIATPHYGARLATLCAPLISAGLPGIKGICQGHRQAEDMDYGSQFLWDLHQAWRNAHKRPPDADILTIVGTSDDVVGEPANATLPDLGVVPRYVNKNHSSVISSFLEIHSPTLLQGALLPCGRTSGIVCVDANHPTFKLVRSFLQSPPADPTDCGAECMSTPPSLVGNLFLRFVEKKDLGSAIPVGPLASQKVVTFGPISTSGLRFHGGSSAGTLFVTNLPAGQYPLTIHGLEFNVISPKYMDEFPLATIAPGRTTVLQQALQRTADIFTVVLAASKTVYTVGKETFSLFVHLCCTIQTAQSTTVQSSITDAEAQSTLIDGYVWVEIPGGARFFLMPDFTNFTDVRTPVVASLPIQDFAGTLLSMPIPAFLPTGLYTFFAVGVVPGNDPFNSANWVTNRAELSVTLTQ